MARSFGSLNSSYMPKIILWSLLKNQHYFYNPQSLFSTLTGLTHMFCAVFRAFITTPTSSISWLYCHLQYPNEGLLTNASHSSFLPLHTFHFLKIKHILSDENLLSLRMYTAWKRSSENVVNTDHIIGVSVQLLEKLLRKWYSFGLTSSRVVIPYNHIVFFLFGAEFFFFLGQYKIAS